MGRQLTYIFIVFFWYSCSTSRLPDELAPIPEDIPSSFQLTPDKYSVVGDVQPFNTEIRVDTLEEGLFLLHLNLYTDFPSGLPKFKFELKYPVPTIDVLWSSRTWSSSSFINIPNYARLQSDDNIISASTKNSNNRITLASTDPYKGRYTGIDIGMQKDSLVFIFNFFNRTQPDAEFLEYNTQILIDVRDLQFSKSIRNASQWLIDQSGPKTVTKVDPSLQPVYSLWYPMHKNIPLENVTHYFDSIANMGFRSVLFDDAWQNVVRFDVDTSGYWDPSETTIVKEFMEKAREKKFKVALWYSQPFVGAHRYVFKKFDGRYLQYRTSSQPILDIRYPEVRDYLSALYNDVVTEWKVDGIWFDFLNGYYPDEHIIATPDNGRDFISVRKALDSLRQQMELDLLVDNPNISINQSYPVVGPLISSNTKSVSGFLGTSALGQVREKMVNNRLMYGEYSPFIEVMGIHPRDPAFEVARKFHSIIFAVPYVSYFSYTLPEEVRVTLNFWIKYWRANLKYLTEGDFEAYYPVARYPVLKSGNEEKQIIVFYERSAPINLGTFNFEMADIINSSSFPVVSLKGYPEGRIDFLTFNHKGDFIKKGELKFRKDVADLEVPPGGYSRLIVKKF